MKHYLIEPQTKKCVIEREHFRRTREDGVVEMLEMETGWRWGSFMIHVPETDEEIQDLLEDWGVETLAEYLEDRGADSLEQALLPDTDEEELLLTEDYNADMLETDDGCWVVFNVFGKDLDEEQCEAITEQAEEAYGEDWYDGLESLGWQQGDVYFELHGEFELTECDDGGNPL